MDLWDYVTAVKFAQLFSSDWRKEAERGQRRYTVPEETLSWLEDQLIPYYFVDLETSNGPDSKRTTILWVLERMREGLASSELAFCMISFRDTAQSPSYFVRVVRDTTHVDENETRGIPWFRGTRRCRFEIDLDELRKANYPRLRLYIGPTVTLLYLQW